MNASAREDAEASGKARRRSHPVEYDEVHKYGGGIRCNTMQLIREKGPTTFA